MGFGNFGISKTGTSEKGYVRNVWELKFVSYVNNEERWPARDLFMFRSLDPKTVTIRQKSCHTTQDLAVAWRTIMSWAKFRPSEML
ncbi:hypothetical protein IFM89_020472 [Coptis chinensis]|uniref:Uncharacterized protein n=1 Tax=Coptis chinensis TaxID=261450 RepID=A0A835H4L6_9MAGN|nr:hypothetical protein IFM89_020472 [Coptis chinensis]